MSSVSKSQDNKEPANFELIKSSDRITYPDLVQLLFQLDAYYREEGKESYGSISSDSLKKDDQNRIVLDFAHDEFSLCERTLKDEPDAYRFVNVGESPKLVDDLTSLGVAVAEQILPINKRPPRSGDYRGELAKLIEGGWYKKISQSMKLGDRNRRDRLVVCLLQSKSRRYKSVNEFLRMNVGLLQVMQDGTIQPANRFDIAMNCLIGTIAAFLAFLLICFLGLQLLETQRKLNTSVEKSKKSQQELEEANSQVVDLKAEKHDFEIRVAELNSIIEQKDQKIEALEERIKASEKSGTPPPLPHPEKYPVKLLTDLKAYKLIRADESWKDKKTKSILRLDEATRDDLEYVRSRMQDYQKASKEWRRWTDKKYSKEEIEDQIKANKDTEVTAFLRKWLALSDRNTYKISISKIKDPNKYQNYLLTLNGKTVRRFKRAKGDTAVFPDKPAEYSLSWKYGDSISVFWEEDGYVYDKNLLYQVITGHLSLHWISHNEVKQGDYAMSFETSGLPGPKKNVAKTPVYPLDYSSYDEKRRERNEKNKDDDEGQSKPDGGPTKRVGNTKDPISLENMIKEALDP